MAITKLGDIIRRTELVLQDATAARWTLLEIQDWVNDAYKEITLMRPDANSTTAPAVYLTPGSTRQRLSDLAVLAANVAIATQLAGALRVLNVTRNTAATSTKQSIRYIDQRILDDQKPTWHADTPAVTVLHWMFDIRIPKEILVYPAPTALTTIEIAISSVPAPHAVATEALLAAEKALPAITINLDDIYANAVLDYVLYRCYSKDADYAANGQRAVSHMNAFITSLGGKTASDSATAPASVTPMTGRGA
jgi:hypothetical protein